MKNNRTLLSIIASLAICSIAPADHHNHPLDLPGVWNVEASADGSSRKLTWTITEKDGNYKGVSHDHEEGDERKFDSIVVKEKSVTLGINIEVDGRKGSIQIKGEEESPGKLAGKWSLVEDDGTEHLSGKFTASKEVPFAGEWAATAEMPDGSANESTLTLSGKNSALKGDIEGALGKVDLDKITATDEELRLEFEFEGDGNLVDVLIKVKPKNHDELAGMWTAKGEDGSVVAEGKWSAKRKLVFAGKWNVVAGVPDNADYNGTLTLTAKNGKYTGASQRDGGETRKLTSVKVDGNDVVFTIPFEYQGNTGKITVEAKLQKDGSLKGEWALTGEDDSEYVRESWRATKK